MIRRPPRSTLDRSSAASDVYKRQVLLRALHQLNQDGMPVKLTIIGDGTCRDGLEKQALELGLSENTHFAGWLTGPEAVSYTHLRAHETVLDIVCRLLLETKNRPQC